MHFVGMFISIVIQCMCGWVKKWSMIQVGIDTEVQLLESTTAFWCGNCGMVVLLLCLFLFENLFLFHHLWLLHFWCPCFILALWFIKNELACYVIASHSQMFNRMPLFTVAFVVAQFYSFMTFLKQLICCLIFEVRNM